MKLINIYLIASTPNALATKGWSETCQAITSSIGQMKWPVGSKSFRIPRKCRDHNGPNKKAWLRNGVLPIKAQFQSLMKRKKHLTEHGLSLAPYFVKHRQLATESSKQILNYPSLEPLTATLKENVGHFDFLVADSTGFKTVIEWETGNISSSHRSLNKMCMALWADLCDAAVLIVPSRKLYEHLTDRIGNVTEIEPYFYFYNRAAFLAVDKILALFVVEHDEDFYSENPRDFIPRGADGNSFRENQTAAKLRAAREKAKRNR